jgi:tyrosyl-tRNA synthetase
MEGLQAADLLEVFADVSSTELPRAEVEGAAVAEVAARAGLCRSRSEARRLIESGGLYLNNRRVGGVSAAVAAADIIDGRVFVLRSGRKTFHLVKVG